MGLIDHISLGVSDLDRSRAFYEAALAPLGIRPTNQRSHACDFERDGEDDFAIIALKAGEPSLGPPHQNHFAFRAPSRVAVDGFYAAALRAGGRDDGPPGLRPEYHAGYYAAFILDPDGHRIEAVHHTR